MNFLDILITSLHYVWGDKIGELFSFILIIEVKELHPDKIERVVTKGFGSRIFENSTVLHCNLTNSVGIIQSVSSSWECA